MKVEAESRSPLAFIALVFALSAPFWLAGALSGWQPLPGLPISALMAVCPLIAASALAYRARQTASVGALLRRGFDAAAIEPKTWWLPIVLLMPGLLVVTYGVMRALGQPLPAPEIPLAAAGLFAVFLVAGYTEESGWTGYATDPLQARWTALGAALLLGLIWAVWHAIPYVQAGRSPSWIAGQFVSTVALRVLIVWIYDNAGKSVVAAIVLHAMANLSEFLFPVNGSLYDPLVAGPIMAVAAAIVAIAWGPRTLATFRFS